MVLNEPGKIGREGRIELPAVNPVGEVLYHPQTPVGGVAPGPVGVVELVAVQNPGPVEEVVDEGIDRNHVGPDLAVVPTGVSRQEETRQGHVGELRADIRNGADFPDEAVEEGADRTTSGVALSKVLVGKCIKVPPTNIPEEEIQREGHVVQRPPFHVEPREWTGTQEGGFIAVFRAFSVAAPL